MGVPDNATVRRLSNSSATRWVWIFAGLRDAADPEARRFCSYVERADVFLAGSEVLPAAAGGWGDLPVLG